MVMRRAALGLPMPSSLDLECSQAKQAWAQTWARDLAGSGWKQWSSPAWISDSPQPSPWGQQSHSAGSTLDQTGQPLRSVLYKPLLWASLVAQMVKNPPAIRRPGFDPWVEKIPWRRARQPTPVFLPRESPWTEEPCRLQSSSVQLRSHVWLFVTPWTVARQASLSISNCRSLLHEPTQRVTKIGHEWMTKHTALFPVYLKAVCCTRQTKAENRVKSRKPGVLLDTFSFLPSLDKWGNLQDIIVMITLASKGPHNFSRNTPTSVFLIGTIPRCSLHGLSQVPRRTEPWLPTVVPCSGSHLEQPPPFPTTPLTPSLCLCASMPIETLALTVLWLRLWAPKAGDMGLTPGQGTRSHISQLRVLMLQLRTSTAK